MSGIDTSLGVVSSWEARCLEAAPFSPRAAGVFAAMHRKVSSLSKIRCVIRGPLAATDAKLNNCSFSFISSTGTSHVVWLHPRYMLPSSGAVALIRFFSKVLATSLEYLLLSQLV